MDPRGTPSLAGHSCVDFPSRTTQSCQLPVKEVIKPNIWPEFCEEDQHAKPSQKPYIYISSATVWVVLDLLKVLAIPSDTTVRRSAVDPQNLISYWKSEKRPHFSRWSTISYYLQVFHRLY